MTQITEREPAWYGPHGKGAMRGRRAEKRQEAEDRNARTLPNKRSIKRLIAAALADVAAPPCPCADKQGSFASPQEAAAVLAALPKKSKNGLLRPYKCPCGSWHLGRRSRGPERNARAA